MSTVAAPKPAARASESLISKARGLITRYFPIVPIVFHTFIVPISILQTIAISTFPLFWPILILYAILIRIDTRPERGQPFLWWQLWFRKLRWWKEFANYYPIKLHKTVDLEPSSPPVVPNGLWSYAASLSWPDTPIWFVTWPLIFLLEIVNRIFDRGVQKLPPSNGRKYLFAIHPHGIISMGAFCAIGTEGANWSSLFPGVLTHVLTLASNFYFPFYRQYLLALGLASVSKTSCMNLLNNNQNICIVVGGARESMLAQPGKCELVLDCRKGFIKVALRSGATLVPVISFGENDAYDQVDFKEGSFGHRALEWMTHNLGFCIPLFHARGISSKAKGFIAYNRPINVVVGRPIEVPLEENPTREQVEEYHLAYVRELKQLFAENVNKYTPGVELKIVE